MRKLKLQMQLSLDGFVAGPNGELDWMTWNWDDKLKQYVSGLTDTIDTILLGRKMTAGFIGHWENVVDNQKESEEHKFAQKMVNANKIIFTKTLNEVNGRNARVENGDLVGAVKKLKSQEGKDMIVYGGAGFVTSLVKEKLIDELYLFVNPTAIGKGLSIFSDKVQLQFDESQSFDSGIVLLRYQAK